MKQKTNYLKTTLIAFSVGLIILCSHSPPCFGQKKETLEPEDPLQKLKWEVGTGFYDFTQNRFPGMIRLKRHFSNDSDKGKAIRFGINPYFYEQKFRDRDNPFPPSYNITVLAGIEFQTRKNKLSYYYGLDLERGLKYSKYGLGIDNYQEDQGKTFNVAPFIGVRYFFLNQFSFSIESNFKYSYEDLTYKRVSPGTVGNIFFERNGVEETFTLSPISSFNLNFHF